MVARNGSRSKCEHFCSPRAGQQREFPEQKGSPVSSRLRGSVDCRKDASSRSRLARLLAVALATERSKSDIAQSHGIALAGPGGVDDAPGNDFIHDGRLPAVAQLLAG